MYKESGITTIYLWLITYLTSQHLHKEIAMVNKPHTNDDWIVPIATAAIIFFLLWLGLNLAHYPVGQ